MYIALIVIIRGVALVALLCLGVVYLGYMGRAFWRAWQDFDSTERQVQAVVFVALALASINYIWR